jgi:hypothetical protein
VPAVLAKMKNYILESLGSDPDFDVQDPLARHNALEVLLSKVKQEYLISIHLSIRLELPEEINRR